MADEDQALSGFFKVLSEHRLGNVNAVELFSSTPSKLGVEEDFWQAVRGAGKHLDQFEHVWQTLRPRVVILLHKGLNSATYFGEYQVEKISQQDGITHYRLPQIQIDVFHVPHPVNMKFHQGADHFCTKLAELLIAHKLAPRFPQFLKGKAEALEVMEFLYRNGPTPNECDKFDFVAWVATELKKRDSFMSIPALCDLLNRKGYKTDYGSSYEAGRGSYRLVRAAYYRMMKRDEPEPAANIALSFKRPNFTYAYSTETDQTAEEETKEPTSQLSRFVGDASEITFIAAPEMEDRQIRAIASEDPHHRLPPPARRVDLGLSHSYTSSQFERIRQNFVPMDMDEKWFIYYEAPWLYIHQSGTGVCVYGVRFETSASGASIVESWANRDSGQYQETSIESDRELCMFFIGTLLLGQDLEYPS